MSEREKVRLSDGTEVEIESRRDPWGDQQWYFLPKIPRRFWERRIDDEWETVESLIEHGGAPYLKAMEQYREWQALPTLERSIQSALAEIPQGQLWQECCVRGCRTEPVNLCCQRCDSHCTCAADIRERIELEAAAPGLQAKIAEYDDQARRGIE